MFYENQNYDKTISNYKILDNLYGKEEAILFSTNNEGYIIVNLNDLSIPEMSLYNNCPLIDYDNPVYNGPLDYYYESNGIIKSILDDLIVDINDVTYFYTKENLNYSLEDVYSLFNTKQARYVKSEKYLSGELKKWYISGGNCGSIASAICMRYYYDYVDTSYVDSDKIEENTLIALMQEYVGEGGTNYNNLYKGLNKYFKSRNINNNAIKKTSFNFSNVKQAILSDRPIIVGTLKHPTYKDHWIIAHGYFESRVDGSYIIINNGWKNNNVWIVPDANYLDGTISFEN